MKNEEFCYMDKKSPPLRCGEKTRCMLSKKPCGLFVFF